VRKRVLDSDRFLGLKNREVESERRGREVSAETQGVQRRKSRSLAVLGMTIFVLGEGSGEWDGLVGTSLKASDACLELFDFADLRRSGAAPLRGLRIACD
jgi:hypothetical protein